MSKDPQKVNGFWIDEDYFVQIPTEGNILEETDDGLSVKVTIFNRDAEVVELTDELHEKISSALNTLLKEIMDEFEEEDK